MDQLDALLCEHCTFKSTQADATLSEVPKVSGGFSDSANAVIQKAGLAPEEVQAARQIAPLACEHALFSRAYRTWIPTPQTEPGLDVNAFPDGTWFACATGEATIQPSDVEFVVGQIVRSRQYLGASSSEPRDADDQDGELDVEEQVGEHKRKREKSEADSCNSEQPEQKRIRKRNSDEDMPLL